MNTLTTVFVEYTRCKLLLRLALFGLLLIGSGVAQAAELTCPGEHQISETLSNGASWQMCWESRKRENIVLSEVSFQPPSAESIPIFSSLRLSQLHVAYDDANVTYNDITQFGLGAGYMSTLDENDCPAGELINVQGRPGLCKMINIGDDFYRTTQESRAGSSLTLFSVSQVGSYAYLVTWKFFDDGSVQPSIGAAGALQRSDDWPQSPFGRELSGVPDKSWLSHTHNYYWRIDFDLGESGTDDLVSEVSFPLDAEGRRSRKETVFTEETARKILPEEMLSWQISSINTDSRLGAASYEITPRHYGHKLVRSITEPFTDFDFFVTRQKDCERFVSENAKFNPNCDENILQFVDNESLLNEDIVVWHRVAFHHVPRNEDRQTMHSHWDGFVMQARNLSASTPGHTGIVDNSPPRVFNPGKQTSTVGEEISLRLNITDEDGDALDYQAGGLPDGLAINPAGLITGRPSNTGEFSVTISASDSFETGSQNFVWDVLPSSNSSGPKAGSLSPFGMGALGLLLILYGLVSRCRIYPATNRALHKRTN